MITKSLRFLAATGFASAVFFSFTAGAFAVEPTPTPTDTVTPQPVSTVFVDYGYVSARIDDTQFTALFLVLLLIFILSLATFVLKVTAPISLRRTKK